MVLILPNSILTRCDSTPPEFIGRKFGSNQVIPGDSSDNVLLLVGQLGIAMAGLTLG